MKFGVMSFNTEYTIRPDELAKAAEQRGLESVWFPEHTHIPAGRRTPYPGGGALPKEYIHMSDPFASVAAAAAVTNRILLGTASASPTFSVPRANSGLSSRAARTTRAGEDGGNGGPALQRALSVRSRGRMERR